MKASIITFHNTSNYGATLQCLALCSFLSNQGIDVEVINYLPSYVRDKKGALKTLNDLLKNKEEAVMILSVVAMNFLDIYRAKVLTQDNVSRTDFIESFDYKGKEFRLNKALSETSKYNFLHLQKIINALTEVDYRLKTTTFDKQVILEELILKIFY